MAAKVLLPTALRQYADRHESVEMDGGSVGELLDNLTERFAALRDHLYDSDGQLRNFVNVYVNDEDIRYQKGMETPVSDGDVISIIPSVAGGRTA